MPPRAPKAQYTSRPPVEEEFLNEMTRKLLCDWCHALIARGSLPPLIGFEPYVEYAKAKGWLSKDGSKILTPGWKTASAFLRR